ELTNPQEVMESRLLLEPELARRAATRARGEHITEMELCMQKMSELTSRSSDWSFSDRRFHPAICRAANNTLLLALLETIQGNMDRGTWGELSEKLHHSSSSEGSMQDHLAILTPIKNRNSTCASCRTSTSGCDERHGVVSRTDLLLINQRAADSPLAPEEHSS